MANKNITDLFKNIYKVIKKRNYFVLSVLKNNRKPAKNAKRKKEQKKERKNISMTGILLSEKNMVRDITFMAISAILLVLLVTNNRQPLVKRGVQPVQTPQIATEDTENQEAENPVIDTTNWIKYANDWYGFELKYPNNWEKTEIKSTNKDDRWEYRYQFRKEKAEKNNPYVGFDVVIYDIQKVKEFYNTDEFPTFKSEELKKEGISKDIKIPIAKNENYSIEQIYIGEDDKYYNPAYFYTLVRDNYIYNITPASVFDFREKKFFEPKSEVTDMFPEFVSAASTFELIDIKRPKPKITVVKPRINAPRPATETARDSLGRTICKGLKGDDPHKSNKGKGKHLDMECCLDPDEYPNPWCYYPPSKYGKYL